MKIMSFFSKFLAGRIGKRFYNYAYCWGACLVILGAVFKIIHLPYDNLLLLIGMGVEVFIFFISGFDEPAREYKWERVFPELNSKNTSQSLSSVLDISAPEYNIKMQQMAKNIDTLNETFEMHIEGLRQQAETIGHLNHSLNRLKGMYEQTATNNQSFSLETEKMVKQVNALNHQYSRMLDAMNVKTEQ